MSVDNGFCSWNVHWVDFGSGSFVMNSTSFESINELEALNSTILHANPLFSKERTLVPRNECEKYEQSKKTRKRYLWYYKNSEAKGQNDNYQSISYCIWTLKRLGALRAFRIVFIPILNEHVNARYINRVLTQIGRFKG